MLVSRSFAIPHISRLISLVKGKMLGKNVPKQVHVGVMPKLIVADYNVAYNLLQCRAPITQRFQKVVKRIHSS